MVMGPVRQVRDNPFSTTARLSSAKLGRTVQAESLLEYDFLSILDFDPRVEKYGEQCIAIPWRDASGRRRRYSPDVLVKFDRAVVRRINGFSGDPNLQFRGTVYEVKPSTVLAEDWAELKPKFQGAQRALRGTGVRFRLMTERQINQVFAANVRILVGYKQPPPDNPKLLQETAIDEELHDLIRNLKEPISPQQILDRYSQSFEVRARILGRLWRMVALCKFDADLTEPLTMNTPLWPGQLFRIGHDFPVPKWRQPEHDWYR